MADHVPLTSQNEPSNTLTLLDAHHPSKSPKAVIRHVLQTAWQDVNLITKSIRSHYNNRIWLNVGLFSTLLGALMSSGLIIIASYNSSDSYCDPGGSFNYEQKYNPWAQNHIFQITLGFGRLTFTQAKVIDVVWDVVIGRGGQFVLAAICFHTFSKTLNLILEQPKASVSYNGFRAIVFEKPSLSSTSKLAGELKSMRGWRSKASILWMVMASIYVVAFPTMISAMTGYSANVDPYFDDGTGNGKKPMENYEFHRAIYRITGADRIEGMQLSAIYLVGSQGFGSISYGIELDYYYCAVLEYRKINSTEGGDCSLVSGITQYITDYGSDSSQITTNTSILLNGTSFTVQAPGLSIETFNTQTNSPYYYRNQEQPYLSNINRTAPYMYTITNGTDAYEAAYINNSGGSCDSQATYVWGFSFILLFGFFVVTGVWTLGMYVMWTDTRRNSRLDRAGRKMGFYRGVVDISNAMWKDTLREPGEMVSDSAIRDMMAEKLNGGRIAFDEIDRIELPPARKGAFRRFKQDIPSIRGWTKTWTLLHWAWFWFFAFVGFGWFWIPLVFLLDNERMLQFTIIINLIVTGVFWLVTLVMFLATIPGLTRICHRVPLLGKRLNPRRLSHWIWTLIFTIAGGLNLFFAVSVSSWSNPYQSGSRSGFGSSTWNGTLLHITGYPFDYRNRRMRHYTFYINVSFAGLFWFVAAIMLLIGLFSTLWRWVVQFIKLFWWPQRRHKVIPLTEEDTSYLDRPTNDPE